MALQRPVLLKRPGLDDQGTDSARALVPPAVIELGKDAQGPDAPRELSCFRARPAPGVNGHGAEPYRIQYRQVNFYTSKAKRPLRQSFRSETVVLNGQSPTSASSVRVKRLCNGRGRRPLNIYQSP